MNDVTQHQHVIEKLADRRDALGGLHEEMEIDEVFISGSADDPRAMSVLNGYLRGFPAEFRARIPSIASDAMQRLRNQVYVGETPDVHLRKPPIKRGERKVSRERDEKTELEQYLKSYLGFIERYGSESPFITSTDHMFGLGMTVVAYPLVYSRVPNHPFALKNGKTREPRNEKERKRLQQYQRERRGAMPFDVVPKHPSTALFDLYNDPIQDMIIEEDVLAGTLRRFEHLQLQDRQSRTTGTLVSFCNSEVYGYWWNGLPLLTSKEGADDEGLAPNTTGILWYGMARSGFGYRNAKGDWKYAIKGVVRDARAVILSLITDYNVQEIMKLLYVWPEEEVEVTTEEGRQEAEERQHGPGAKWIHGTGARKLPTDATQIPQWGFQIQNINTALAEAHLGSRVLSGEIETGPASRLRTNVGLALAPTKATKQALNHLWSNILNDCLYMQKHDIGQPLLIPTTNGYMDFDATKIPDDALVEVEVTPVTAEEKQLQLQGAIQRVAGGTMSVRRMLELDPDVDDVDEELIEIDADAIMRIGDSLKVASDEATRRFQAHLAEKNGAAPNPGGLPQEDAAVTTVGSQQDIQRNGFNALPPGGL